MDHKTAVGNTAFNILISGNGSTYKNTANTAEMVLVDRNTNVASGKMGMVDHLLSTAAPAAQKIPAQKNYKHRRYSTDILQTLHLRAIKAIPKKQHQWKLFELWLSVPRAIKSQ